MQLELGLKIRELRHRDGRTQEMLADALGVTSQAISRWESGNGYPDTEMLPRLAKCFGVTLDGLFGFEGNRERRVRELTEQVERMAWQNEYEDVNLDACIALLREGLFTIIFFTINNNSNFTCSIFQTSYNNCSILTNSNWFSSSTNS